MSQSVEVFEIPAVIGGGWGIMRDGERASGPDGRTVFPSREEAAAVAEAQRRGEHGWLAGPADDLATLRAQLARVTAERDRLRGWKDEDPIVWETKRIDATIGDCYHVKRGGLLLGIVLSSYQRPGWMWQLGRESPWIDAPTLAAAQAALEAAHRKELPTDGTA